MLEPAFFDGNRLFGIYHPATDGSSDRLAVICPPLFDEYRRCYRALAELAKGCASAGTHVFRFDYFGTGESWGELNEASVEGWVTDIRSAIEEGLALSGASQVYLLGVRFGGTLAAQVKHPQIVEYLFWDLVRSGSDYLQHLKRADAELERFHVELADYVGISPGPVEYQQFELASHLEEGIGKLTAAPEALEGRARVHHVVSNEAQVGPHAEFSGFAYDWPVTHEGLLLPKPVLETLARRFA